MDPSTGHLASIIAAALCVKPRGLLTKAQAAKVDAFKALSADFAAIRGTGDAISWYHPQCWHREAHHLAAQRGAHRALRHSQLRPHAAPDLAAVRNAITETWSNGQVEGQINRLKTLKPAMYGRASVELLRARMMPLHPTQRHTV